MAQHHYLGFHGMIGESLRFIAVYQHRWLALLGWCYFSHSIAILGIKREKERDFFIGI